MKEGPTTASFAGFARVLGKARSYVTDLRKAGRLVLTEDGKRVLVDESLARIKATEDPSKAHVAARHAQARTDAARGAGDVPGQSEDAEPAPASSGYSYWRERSEKAKALQAERENAIAEGELLRAKDVAAVLGRAGANLRSALENLPIAIAPELAAEADEGRVRALLTEHIEHTLGELSRQFGTLARTEEVTP